MGPAPRRHVRWLAAAAWVTLAVAPAAGPIAVAAAFAQEPGGGYHDPYVDRAKEADNGLEAVRSAARAPLRWLRQSSRSFQSLMRLLAERSALQAGHAAPLPLRSKRPRMDPVEAPEDPQWRSSYGGEAGAGGHDGVRVKEWVRRTPGEKAKWDTGFTSCQRAGVPVRRGRWYVVERGDTLWHIAELHYGHGEAYPRLRRANSERVRDVNVIHPCQRLYIPPRRCCGLAPE